MNGYHVCRRFEAWDGKTISSAVASRLRPARKTLAQNQGIFIPFVHRLVFGWVRDAKALQDSDLGVYA